jgi:hypothetical protein
MSRRKFLSHQRRLAFTLVELLVIVSFLLRWFLRRLSPVAATVGFAVAGCRPQASIVRIDSFAIAVVRAVLDSSSARGVVGPRRGRGVLTGLCPEEEFVMTRPSSRRRPASR